MARTAAGVLRGGSAAQVAVRTYREGYAAGRRFEGLVAECHSGAVWRASPKHSLLAAVLACTRVCDEIRRCSVVAPAGVFDPLVGRDRPCTAYSIQGGQHHSYNNGRECHGVFRSCGSRVFSHI
ncbi:hypothetical protein Trydic_g7408 [Trypoxylus dichotomus]